MYMFFLFFLHGCYLICESVSDKKLKIEVHSVLFNILSVPSIFYGPQLKPNWICDFDTEKNFKTDHNEADLGFCYKYFGIDFKHSVRTIY